MSENSLPVYCILKHEISKLANVWQYFGKGKVKGTAIFNVCKAVLKSV